MGSILQDAELHALCRLPCKPGILFARTSEPYHGTSGMFATCRGDTWLTNDASLDQAPVSLAPRYQG